MTDSDSQLNHLDLQGVAFTATVRPDGTLGKVGGFWDKLDKHIMDLAYRGLLHTVVVSDKQPDVPQAYLRPNGLIFVIRAKTVNDAISQLDAHSLSRRSVQEYERKLSAEFSVWENSAAFGDSLYQQLPLLQKIEPKQLPLSSDAEMSEHDPRLDQPTERQVDLESWLADFAGIPRFVVTGAPGSGKSTLAQYLAWRAATNNLQPGGRPLLPLRVSLKDWAAAVGIGKPLPSLPAYLAQCYGMCKPAAGKDDFNRWLHKGNVLLLLDGLDEVQGEQFSKALNRTLTQYSDCPTVLTCRTLHYEQYQSVASKFEVFKLTPLTSDQQDNYIRAYATAFGGLQAEALSEWLNRSPQMRTLAGSPLLLSAICYCLADSSAPELPETRGELFDQLVTKLLTRQRTDITYPGTGTAPDPDTKREVLECVALHGFLRDEGRFTFKGGWIRDRIKDALEDADYNTELSRWSQALRKDLVNVGLLKGKADKDYRFLHTAIQEFLAADALARIINDPKRGWNATLPIAGRSYPIASVIDHKAWDPAWHEVVLLLAGQLDDPTPLLEMLSKKEPTKTNPHGDDHFRHRLALTAECLPQIPERSRTAKLTDVITTELFVLWWQYAQSGTLPVVGQLTEAMRAIVAVNGRVDGTYVLDHLGASLRHKDSNVRQAAAETIGRIGRAVACHDIVDGIFALLHDTDFRVRLKASFAIGSLGSAPALCDILDRLLKLLDDKDSDVRRAALYAIRNLGNAAALPDILNRLLEFMHDEGTLAPGEAALAIGAMGRAAVRDRDDILDSLLELLNREDSAVPIAAADAIGRLGIAAATDDIVDRLLVLLHDKNRPKRGAVAYVIGNLGSAAARPEILNRLFELLHDEDSNVRHGAARSIARLCSPAARAAILDRLFQFLHDSDPRVRGIAVYAIGEFGNAAARPEIVDHLPELLHDGVPSVRAAAAKAIGKMGSAAISDDIDDIFDVMLALLRDKDRTVRVAVADAIAVLGPIAARPGILDALNELLHDKNSMMPWVAAQGIEAMGSAAASDDILKRLPELVNNKNIYAGLAALDAICNLGPASTCHYITEVIMLMLEKATFSFTIGFRSIFFDEIRLPSYVLAFVRTLISLQHEVRIFRRSDSHWYANPIVELATAK